MKKDILKDLLAKPGKKHLVSDFDSSFTGDLSKQDAKEQLAKDIEKLSELQSMLYGKYSITYLSLYFVSCTSADCSLSLWRIPWHSSWSL